MVLKANFQANLCGLDLLVVLQLGVSIVRKRLIYNILVRVTFFLFTDQVINLTALLKSATSACRCLSDTTQTDSILTVITTTFLFSLCFIFLLHNSEHYNIFRYISFFSCFNIDQADDDADGVGEVCDNCPGFSNSAQTDDNQNGVGDDCEDRDQDGDGIYDFFDNCRTVPNGDQSDTDADGTGGLLVVLQIS